MADNAWLYSGTGVAQADSEQRLRSGFSALRSCNADGSMDMDEREGNSGMRLSERTHVRMSAMIRVAAFGIAAFVASSSVAWASSVISKNEAGRVVKKFCGDIITAKSMTDPANPANQVSPDRQPAVYRQIVTSELADLFGRAVARSLAVQAATGNKPVMGDSPWTSVADGVSDCLAGSISGTRHRPQVAIRYVLTDDVRTIVTDTLVLKKEAGEWKIDDIRYGSSTDRLRSVLARAISEGMPASRQ